jgi:hypothetical protein
MRYNTLLGIVGPCTLVWHVLSLHMMHSSLFFSFYIYHYIKCNHSYMHEFSYILSNLTNNDMLLYKLMATRHL